MLITPLQLEKEPLLFDESIPAGALDYAPRRHPGRPAARDRPRRPDLSSIAATASRSPTSALRAAYKGDFELLCARCVEPVPTPLSGNFDLIFRPQAADADPGERSITPDETEIGYYEESGLIA